MRHRMNLVSTDARLTLQTTTHTHASTKPTSMEATGGHKEPTGSTRSKPAARASTSLSTHCRVRSSTTPASRDFGSREQGRCQEISGARGK
uniref:Uncharacterized protein n=1 Tax=Aegilops tauschii subsp. strangulata TaxID=200361 RepID=A0A452YDB6_AEGTS